MSKFEIVENDSICIKGIVMYRIRALIDFGDVCAGELGGYIQKKENLSQVGNAWVYDDARVYGDAQVYDDARVYDDTRVYGNAWVYGNAQVYGNAWVYGNARVYGNAWVYGNAQVYGNAWVYGNARIANKHCIVWFSNVGTEFGTLTVYCGKTELLATRGCFYGTLDEFCAKSSKNHNKQIKNEYSLLAEMARLRLAGEQNKICESEYEQSQN